MKTKYRVVFLTVNNLHLQQEIVVLTTQNTTDILQQIKENGIDDEVWKIISVIPAE